MTKALIMKTDGTTEEYEYNRDYKALQEIVEGYIEPITFGDKQYFCYCNEESKIIKLEQNRVATDLWYDSGQRVLIGDYIAGTVIFFGQVDDEGNDTDYPQQLVNDLARYKK
jgi:hypothetical protein